MHLLKERLLKVVSTVSFLTLDSSKQKLFPSYNVLVNSQVTLKTRVSEFGTCRRGESIMLDVDIMNYTNDRIFVHKADKQSIETW